MSDETRELAYREFERATGCKIGRDEPTEFSEHAKTLSQKLRNCRKLEKQGNGNGRLQRAPVRYCQAIFYCPSKQHIKVRPHKAKAKHRVHQVCTFQDRCNQQCYEPVYWTVET